MIYLLGGPPKVGKSKIACEIRQRYALSAVSTDSLGAVLENVWSSETAPDLFAKAKFSKKPLAEQMTLTTADFAELLDYVRTESHVVWKAVVAFGGRESEEGRDVLIEGVGVLPELVNQLEDTPQRVVFIGNQGENHRDNIKTSAEENEYDWMHDATDQYIRVFAMFVNRMSVYIEQEAKNYGFEYIEMDSVSFGSVTEEVINSLGLSAS